MNRIKALRLESGIKQADLARELNVSAAALSGYETGKFQASNDTYVTLARKFNVSLDYLLGISDRRSPDGMESLGEAKAAMIRLVDGLSDAQAEQLLEIAQAVFRMQNNGDAR